MAKNTKDTDVKTGKKTVRNSYIFDEINDKLEKYHSVNYKQANTQQMYRAVALSIRDIMLKKKHKNNLNIQKRQLKRVYYLCMEFLIGRSLRNNLYNLGLLQDTEDALERMGFKLDDLIELESDAGLGNGGLGRLAACYMDSLASLNYPAMGFSIRYENGLFKQKILDNKQFELPDLWLDTGEVWMMPRSDKSFMVKLGGKVEEYWDQGKLYVRHVGADIVEAIPYDVMIAGANSEGVSTLRLWRATAANNFDMKSFTMGDYMMATRADNEAELISKVLYPSDDHVQGKQLRLSQQYFLVSASLQCIFKDHLKFYDTLNNLDEKVAIHINDTHPALAIPEMMRLLIDEHHYDWDTAWKMTTGTIAYTNHTVMSEALEKWGEDLVSYKLPRIYSIIKEINRRYLEKIWAMGYGSNSEKTAIIANNQVKMANLSVIGSHSVNGVSALHSDIIKKSVFKEFNTMFPDKFTNVTNGIAYRRWLCQSNPQLTAFIERLIGDGFKQDASQLENLTKYLSDKSALAELGNIKRQNKVSFSNYVADKYSVKLNPDSRFDTQIKRLHEYKRQLLNLLKIVGKLIDIEDNPNIDVFPETFIFGAKAAGGYFHAKRIIELINCLSSEIQKNPKIKEKLDVYFVENYNVTQAEKLIPASEVSEQISLAGKEASGTSNMKFMLNGALTLGTLDGANVEISELVGEDNIYIFGLKTEEVDDEWARGYNGSGVYSSNEKVRRIVDRLKAGFNGQSFSDIATYLTVGGHIADPYMCLKDFDAYVKAAARMDADYRDKDKWNKMALINIAKSGEFSSDRSIEEYAKNIWNLKIVK